VHDAADRDLTGHMVQHIALLTLAPPLVVYGLRLGRSRGVGLPAAVAIHAVVLVGWHVPVLYDAAVRSTPLHVAEHLSLLTAGILLWQELGVGDGAITGGSVLALFVAAVPGTFVGFGMTFAASPWYESYPHLSDQQLAGVLMWGPGGAAYAFAAGALVVGWLRTEGATT
jgi:cytochrome c oxidase assembly factor CtaG